VECGKGSKSWHARMKTALVLREGGQLGFDATKMMENSPHTHTEGRTKERFSCIVYMYNAECVPRL
jgi:hypothetical protein